MTMLGIIIFSASEIPELAQENIGSLCTGWFVLLNHTICRLKTHYWWKSAYITWQNVRSR